MEKLISIILICGVVINAIIIWLLTKKDKSALPQKILMVFFITIIFILLNVYAEINKLKILYVLTFNLADGISLIIGPLLFIYIKSLFLENKNLVKKNWMHFLYPFIYLVFFSIPILIFKLTDVAIYRHIKTLYNINNLVFVYENIILLIYTIITLQLFNKYCKATKAIYSNIDDDDLKWIKYLLYGIIIIISFDILTFISDYFYPKYNFESSSITMILLVFFLYYLGYKGINQSKILVPDFLLNPNIKTNQTINTLNLKEEEITNYIIKIKKTIKEEALFLDENLSLPKLAEKVNLSDKKLSGIINQKMNTTFYDLINSYRIEEFKKQVLLKENDNITLLGIAFDCGFKSKSTFNRLFKLHEKISPSEFKKTNS